VRIALTQSVADRSVGRREEMRMRSSLALFLPSLVVAAGVGGCRTPDDVSEATAIYGVDDRVEPFDLPAGSVLRQRAASTAAIVSEKLVESLGGGVVRLKGDSVESLCPGERFSSQPSVAACSGVLVADDLVATAGHCIEDASCAKARIVFGFAMDGSDRDPREVDADDVYRCTAVVARAAQSGADDFALIRLDRKAAGRAPVPMRTSGEIAVGTRVAMLGHPLGMPLKAATGARVRRIAGPDSFVANLDAFAGNSGSPVFDAATGTLEGVLSRGEDDFNTGAGGDCLVARRCPDDGCLGESVTKATVFAAQVGGPGVGGASGGGSSGGGATAPAGQPPELASTPFGRRLAAILVDLLDPSCTVDIEFNPLNGSFRLTIAGEKISVFPTDSDASIRSFLLDDRFAACLRS
jgi:hypothetical protein